MSGEPSASNKILTIPNLLSLFRLCLIPVIVWLYCGVGNVPLTALVLALSALTDVVDGRIARKFHMVSQLGKALDPVADKLTQAAVLICLATRFPRMWVLVAFLALKEILSAIINLRIIRKTGTVLGALWHGKIATVLVYATMLIHLIWSDIPSYLSDFLICAAGGVLLLSGILYAVRNHRVLSGEGAQEASRLPDRSAARLTWILLGECFAVYTIVMLCRWKMYSRLPLAVATLFLVLLPEIAQRLLRRTFPAPFYYFSLAYALCPMLGQCHNFYYLFSWWDKLLHLSGGVIFVILGVYLFGRICGRERRNRYAAALFALMFSMSLAVVWEFFEFGSDQLMGSDMQRDTVVTALHSYDLGTELGVTGSIEDITLVTVNGTALPAAGYLDIGLIDTMCDLLMGTLGALAGSGAWLLSRKRQDSGGYPRA